MGSGGGDWEVESGVKGVESKKCGYKFPETFVPLKRHKIIRIRKILPILFLKNEMVKMRYDNLIITIV